jgi:hypothetical protein
VKKNQTFTLISSYELFMFFFLFFKKTLGFFFHASQNYVKVFKVQKVNTIFYYIFSKKMSSFQQTETTHTLIGVEHAHALLRANLMEKIEGYLSAPKPNYSFLTLLIIESYADEETKKDAANRCRLHMAESYGLTVQVEDKKSRTVHEADTKARGAQQE